MLSLDCPTQSYDWGSVDHIPGFLRRDGDGEPVAEMWVGTHPVSYTHLTLPTICSV